LTSALHDDKGNPKFLDDGPAIFLMRDGSLEVDKKALDLLIEKGVAKEGGGFSRITTPLLYNDMPPGAIEGTFPPVPHQVYVDRSQNSAFCYFDTTGGSSGSSSSPPCVVGGACRKLTSRAPFIMIPCRYKANPKRGVILICTHLTSGKSDEEGAKRVSQVKQIESARKRICEVLNRHSDAQWSAVLGMDANTDPNGCPALLSSEQSAGEIKSFKFDAQKKSYTSSPASPVKEDCFDYLANIGCNIIFPDTLSCLKERSFHSDQVRKRGVPTFTTLDVFVTWPPFPKSGYHSVGVNDLAYMMPNVYEPSDHKPVSAWLGMPHDAADKTEASDTQEQSLALL